MSPSSEGGGGTPSSEVPGSGERGEAPQPIGSLAEYQFLTPSFRHRGTQGWEEWQSATACPASPKKRKVDPATSINISGEGLVRLVEETMARILRGFVAPTSTTGSQEGVQALQTEMKDNINKVQTQLMQLVNTAMAKVQAEVDRRADVTLQKLVQMLNSAPKKDNDRAIPPSRADVALGRAAQISSRQGQQQSA
jgi:hypothetical protein